MSSLPKGTISNARIALVTGAAQGIGQAIALALAERGVRVIATDLAIPQETVKKIGSAAYGFSIYPTSGVRSR